MKTRGQLLSEVARLRKENEAILREREVLPTKTFEHRGVLFTIGPRTPCPGIGWRVHLYDYRGEPVWKDSSGAFYDNCEDHPEGAYAWAEASARRFIDKLLAEREAK